MFVFILGGKEAFGDQCGTSANPEKVQQIYKKKRDEEAVQMILQICNLSRSITEYFTWTFESKSVEKIQIYRKIRRTTVSNEHHLAFSITINRLDQDLMTQLKAR